MNHIRTLCILQKRAICVLHLRSSISCVDIEGMIKRQITEISTDYGFLNVGCTRQTSKASYN